MSDDYAKEAFVIDHTTPARLLRFADTCNHCGALTADAELHLRLAHNITFKGESA